jgi:CelD/BcsL family acetyltransferase involved in cellulose biosynthesis
MTAVPAPGTTERVARRAELWEEVEALADSAGSDPFVRPGWVRIWLRSFGGENRLQFVTVRRDGELAAAIPLLRRGRGALVSPTNWHTPRFGPVAVDDDAARELAATVARQAPAYVDVGFLDPAGAFATELRATEGRTIIERPVLRSPYVALGDSLEAYEGKLLTSKFRRELRRRRRKLEELGELSIAFEDGSERLGELLDEGFAVEGSGWKTREGTAIASSAQTDGFYRDVAAWAAERDWLQLGFVRLDGRCLAFGLSIVAGDSMYAVKVGFDPEWRKYAPGSLLTQATVERAFERGLARFDFLGGDDAYKLDWTETIGERVRIQAFGRTPHGLAAHAAWRWGRPLAKAAVDLRERRRAS